ncbi:hypothetical protein [Chlorobium ferrooxidans]|uniref:hypothetical protein n=1 Tax=Chlorobium ferrooxidans TaxID=84205 RepID=UPI000590C407|nr:hypothetical protein [Chlorobium ferrooxidans]
MGNTISVSLEKVSDVIDSFRNQGMVEVLTTVLIDAYMGGFHSNKGISAQLSWNAQFGKILKSEADRLGIREISSGNEVFVNGQKTHASKWLILS